MNYMSENINELGAALAKAQGEMNAAAKDCKNPFYKSKYADLNSIWDACRIPLAKHGLSVTQLESRDETGQILVTQLIHSSGQWIRSVMPIKIKSDGKTNELQAMGSVYTYLRRYSLAALVGISAADEDDDGNVGGKNYQANQVPAMAPPTIAPKLITQSQADELKNILDKCSPDFKKKIDDLLTERKIGGLNALGETLYRTIVERAVNDMKYYQASITPEEPVAV